MDEPAQHAALGELRQRVAGLAQLDALALDAADGEAAADERVEVDAAREHVAARRLVGELDAGVLAQPLERLGGDQREALAGLGRRRPVVLALEAVARLGAHARHRRGQRVAARRRWRSARRLLLTQPAYRAPPRPLAASTSARNSASCPGSSSSVSACHCTASRNGWRGSSIPSIVPSGAHAVATRPSPSVSTAWWWKELTSAACPPSRRAARERAAIRTECVGRRGELGLAVAVDVLVQRAAAGDVERLGAAADAEQRHPRGVGGARELELEAVERRLGRAERLVGAGAVGGGVEVGAAGQADAVEARRAASPSRRLERRQHDGHAAGQLDRAHVGQAERHLVLRRLAVTAQRGEVATPHLRGGDADQRTHRGNVGQRAPILNRRCPANTSSRCTSCPGRIPRTSRS